MAYERISMKKWSQDDINEVFRLRDIEGLRWSEIAQRLNSTSESVRSCYRTKSGSQNEQTSYSEEDGFINIVCSSKRVLSKEDIIKQFNIDLSVWEIEKFTVKTSEGYRKDRSVTWQVKDGRVLDGKVEDTGKMLVVPLYHVEVRLIKKKEVYDAKIAISQMLKDIEKFAPTYQPIKYETSKDGHLFEVDLPDVHFGRLSWADESGLDYDINIAKKSILKVINDLLSASKLYKINKILLPIGNDFFNVDNREGTTARGTPQQEDTRWQKTFKAGREICVEMIDMCSSIAKTDVIIVPGNHDLQRSFYLGDSLESWYRKCKNVTINNSAKSRKYYYYGNNLIGFTHGYFEKLDRLPLIMAHEEPELWAKSSNREWHTGDKHKKKDLMVFSSEDSGMVVRILRALAVADAWTFNMGYVGTKRAAEAFMWHPSNGLVAQFHAYP